MGRPPRINRRQILDVARAQFAAVGFEAATLGAIADALHVTPAAILRHFASKQLLFAAAMAPTVVEPPACVLRLEEEDGTADPRVVLLRLAREFVPFVESVLGASLAVTMHLRARQTTLLLPFDPADPESPAQRGLRIVTGYFRRSMKAGTIEIAEPRAAALLFIGSLQSYVLIHHVLNVQPLYPLDDYLEALIGLWTAGAIRKPHRRTTANRPPGTAKPRRKTIEKRRDR